MKKVQSKQRNLYHPCAKSRVLIGSHTLQQIMGKQNSDITTIKELHENLKKDSFNSSKFEREACGQLQILKECILNQKLELQSIREELQASKNCNQILLKQNIEFNNKLIRIESNYANELVRFGATVQEFQNESTVKQSQYLELMENLTEKRVSWEQNLKKKEEMVTNMEKKINNYEIEIKNLIEQNNSLKSAIEQINREQCLKLQDYNNKFDMMTKELNKKEETINLCLQENKEMYLEKNKTIDELSCKIRRIENVFCQPVKSVQPLPNTSIRGVKEIDTNDSDDDWITSRTLSSLLPKPIRNRRMSASAKNVSLL